MLESATALLPIAVPTTVPLDVDFRGGRLTSDGGLAWLGEADMVLGLSAGLAAQVPEWRRGPVRHSLEVLVRQRVLQIACGYEDQNDAAHLRTDPLLKLVCGRLPASDPDLASQPTLSRLENAVGRAACYRLAVALGQLYLRERERAGIPTRIVLDLDGTDDPTHGTQEQTAYHGYFRQPMYFPLLIFDGDTDHLITAVLRPGTIHASHGVVPILRRVVRAVRARWPAVAIEVRADSGFAIPALYDYCEAEGLRYTLGLGRNERLMALAAALRADAAQQAAATRATTVRLLGEVTYQAGSWPQPRRVIVKAEMLPKGPNTRFVVTNRPDPPEALYAWYTARGETENWIKDLKTGCCADRLSCHRFWANQFRLLLHAAAYWLLDTVRRWLAAVGVARLQLATLRLHLLKVGGWVCQQHDRVRLRLATSQLTENLWRRLATRPDRFVNNPG